MSDINRLAKMAIAVLQQQIASYGYTPRVHFELEGGYQRSDAKKQINYQAINQALKQLNILGALKPEFWQNQWEYVSDFAHQSPLKEASDFEAATVVLPKLLKRFGASKVFIKPILWEGDQGRLHSGCDNIFTIDKRPVHIPNAVQINISADKNGNNVIPYEGFGERLQQKLLDTSYQCCLLYLPEQEGFERLRLKDDFDLDAELSSPHELSGGHQGSIALYKDVGKHNQPMGINPLLLDHRHQVIASTQDWQSLSRIEHRLGASSERYNPYVNVVFALSNLVETIIDFEQDNPLIEAPQHQLPTQLYSCEHKTGAFELFESSNWFPLSVNQSLAAVKASSHQFEQVPDNLGDQLKQQIVDSYQRKLWLEP
jgi:hypothetical protein